MIGGDGARDLLASQPTILGVLAHRPIAADPAFVVAAAILLGK